MYRRGIGHDLKHAAPSKTLERLRRRIGLAFLRGIERMTDSVTAMYAHPISPPNLIVEERTGQWL